jgi:membrane protein required for colicin V production
MLATWVDWVFVAILALAVAAGFVRGLVREALGLASWIVALLVARAFATPLADHLTPWIDSSDGRLITAFVALIIVTILASGILIRMLQAAVEWVGAGFLNRLTGAAFGGIKAAAVLCLVTVLIGFTPLQQLSAWQDAAVRPQFEQLSAWALGQWDEFGGQLPELPEALRQAPPSEEAPMQEAPMQEMPTEEGTMPEEPATNTVTEGQVIAPDSTS